MSSELYESLPPLGQVLLSVAIAVGGGIATWQGLKKAKEKTQSSATQDGPVPLWAMMGPIHEAIQTIHDMAEESRKSNAIASDTLRMMERLDRGQDYSLRLLEAILRNQEMRDDYRPPPTQARATPVVRHSRVEPHPSKEV